MAKVPKNSHSIIQIARNNNYEHLKSQESCIQPRHIQQSFTDVRLPATLNDFEENTGIFSLQLDFADWHISSIR